MPVGAGDLGGDENDGDVPPLSPICLWWPRTAARVRFVVESARTADAGVVWSGVLQHPTSVLYEYCWLEPRIDWNRLTFKSNITDEVLFGNNSLRGQYLRRGGRVRDFFDATRQLELALDWIDLHHRSEVIRDRLIFWMVHICLQQFPVGHSAEYPIRNLGRPSRRGA